MQRLTIGTTHRVCILLGVLCIGWPAAADRNCTDAEERRADNALNLSASERADAEQTHLPFGVPQATAFASDEHLLHQDEYVINYDDNLLVPLWTAYRLRKRDIRQRERVDCFRADPRLRDDQASTNWDYDEPVFDRGHMAPRAAMNRSKNAMLNTFVMSNMTPQFPKFNRSLWRFLEKEVRDWAKEKGEIYVVTGCVFDQDEDDQRDPDQDADRMETGRVAVPTHFYKIVLFERSDGFIESLAILLPHTNFSPRFKRGKIKYVEERLTTIHRIEDITNTDFFPDMDDVKENAVESAKADSLW